MASVNVRPIACRQGRPSLRRFRASVLVVFVGGSVAAHENVEHDGSAVVDLAVAEVPVPQSSVQEKPDAPGPVLRTSRGSASRRGPSTGLKFVPSTDSDYRRTERLRFEVTSDNVSAASARLLGPTATPLAVPVSVVIRVDEPTKQSIVVAEVTLAPLAPAEYELELTLDERGDKNIVNYRFGIVR